MFKQRKREKKLNKSYEIVSFNLNKLQATIICKTPRAKTTYALNQICRTIPNTHKRVYGM